MLTNTNKKSSCNKNIQKQILQFCVWLSDLSIFAVKFVFYAPKPPPTSTLMVVCGCNAVYRQFYVCARVTCAQAA